MNRKKLLINLIILISAIIIIFCGTFIILNKNTNDNYVILYNPVLNTSKKVKYNNINEIKPDKIDGYDFIGWYYDNNQNLPLSEVSNLSNGTVIKAFYTKVIIKETNLNVSETINQYNDKYVTIKTYNNTVVTNEELVTLAKKELMYLNLKDAKIENNIIPENMFNNMPKLEKVYLPDSIIEIGENCFNNCSNLKEIYFGQNLIKINNNSFTNNNKIESINFSDNLKSIGNNSFNNCLNLKDVKLGENIEIIEEKVFLCTSIKNINIDKNTNFNFADGILYNKDFTEIVYATNFIKENLVLDERVKSIKKYAFYKNNSLKSISIPAKIEFIGEKSFYNCENLEKVNFNNSNNYIIEDYAFSECRAIKNIQFFNGLYSLGNGVFKDCISLCSVIFTTSTSENIKNLETLGDYLFSGCKSLVNFIIPETVKKVGVGVFYSCENLESVKLSSKIQKISDKMFYQNISLKNIETDGKIIEVGNSAFFGCISLDNLNFVSDAEIFGIASFENCKSLNDINLDNIKHIKDYAFNNCENITEVNLKRAESLGYKSFANNKNLKTFSFNSLRQFDVSCFDQCENLQEISGLSEFYIAENGVLYNFEKTAIICYPIAKNNENFTILSSIQQINDINLLLNTNIKNFEVEEENTNFSSLDGVLYNYNKTKLISYPSNNGSENFVVPDNVKEIGDFAFYECLNLKELEICKNVDKIGKSILMSASNILSLKVPFVGKNRSVKEKYISYLFGGDSYYDNNKLPETLINFELSDDNFLCENEFANCSYLQNIIICEKVCQIPTYTFSGCISLKSLQMQGNVNLIQSYAFKDIENFKELKIGYDENLVIENYYFNSLKNDISVIIVSDEGLSQSERSLIINKFVNSYRRASWFKFNFKTND